MTKKKQTRGRPRKGQGPKVPHEELDRLLVFGEVVECQDGQSQTVSYPSYRELARRYGVSVSLIANYSKKHDCLRRREQAQARIAVKADQKLVELHATAIAMGKDDELRIIDAYLAGFEKAIAEGRVRFDNPGDFNTMVRLKEFVLGGADSRQEIHASLSLEDIQARHLRMVRTMRSASPSALGELEAIDVDAEDADVPPPPHTTNAVPEVNVQPERSGDTNLNAGETEAPREGESNGR